MALANVVSWLAWGALVAALAVFGLSLARGLRDRVEGTADLLAARICTVVLVLAWVAGAFRLAPPGKIGFLALAILIGGLVGGFVTLGPLRGGVPGNLAAVVALFAALLLGVADPASRQWAALGLALGLALPALAAGIFRLEAQAFSGALLAGQAAALAGALVWGDRVFAAHQVGAGAAIGFAGVVVVMMAIGTWALPGSRQGAPLAAGALAALAAYPLLALALRQPAAAFPAAIGAGMAVLLAFGVGLVGSADEEPPAFLAVVVLVLGGGTLLLINRLWGMPGLGLAGIGLAVLATADDRATRWLAALLPAIFGGRALLHLFLDRTYLRVEGVDVTQTYAFAALILGFVLATAFVRFHDQFASAPLAGGVLALLVAASPVLVGYFIHLLPLAGFLAGVIAAGFALAALADGLERGAARLAPYLALACAGAAAAAPFLTDMINAPRQQRILVFLVVSGVAIWFAVSTLRSQPRPSAAA